MCLAIAPRVAIPVCGLFGLWPFRYVAFLFVAFSVCGHFGLQPFRFFTIWPFRLWPFRFVAVMTCYLLYYPSICRLLFMRLATTIRQGFTFYISGQPAGWRIKSDTLWTSFQWVYLTSLPFGVYWKRHTGWNSKTQDCASSSMNGCYFNWLCTWNGLHMLVE